MHSHSTYSQLAIARADAADRQRRADAHRLRREVEEARGFDRRRATIAGTVAGILSAGLLVAVPTSASQPVAEETPGATAVTTSEQPLRAGAQQGAADGWFLPGAHGDHDPGTHRVPPGVR